MSLKCYLFLTFAMAGLTHDLKGVCLRPPICQGIANEDEKCQQATNRLSTTYPRNIFQDSLTNFMPFAILSSISRGIKV